MHLSLRAFCELVDRMNDERLAKALRTSFHWNNGFMFKQRSPVVKKIRPMGLLLVDLITGRKAGR